MYNFIFLGIYIQLQIDFKEKKIILNNQLKTNINNIFNIKNKKQFQLKKG